MKRHSALVPLSSHHQNALVLAKKLQSIDTRTLDESRHSHAQAVIEFWNLNGQEHFRQEEEVLLPIWAKYEDIWCPQVERMLREHIRIRSLIDTLQVDLENETVPAAENLLDLGKTLEGHIRLEEHEIFERVQQAVPDWDLLRMKNRLQH